MLRQTRSIKLRTQLTVAWLLRYLQRQNTWVFVWYRLAFGVTILAASATGWLRNN